MNAMKANRLVPGVSNRVGNAGYTSITSPDQPKTSHGTAQNTSSTPSLSITNYSLPFRVQGSQGDRQMLHYFFAQGSSDVSGFLSSDFWTRALPQQIQHDYVIRQALVALSSLHLDYVTEAAPGVDTREWKPSRGITELSVR